MQEISVPVPGTICDPCAVKETFVSLSDWLLYYGICSTLHKGVNYEVWLDLLPIGIFVI
jgi:hypothetical protein